jgi:hypothetical protein
VGRPDDIAGLVAFIAGPDGAFMSGSYVIMDGGLRDAGRRMDESGTPIGDERMQLAMQAMERRNRLQPLIDER